MYGTVAPGSCPWAGLWVGAGTSVYCGHISSYSINQSVFVVFLCSVFRLLESFVLFHHIVLIICLTVVFLSRE